MKGTVSIIIPIYNVENYLRRCVDSVVNQTYRDLEIILVDDGSPDNCGKICDQYAAEDSRMIVVHKENGGLADARNAGIEVATGRYLYFLDSDDWIAENAIEVLMSSFERNDDVDIVMGSSVDVHEENGCLRETKYSVELGTSKKINKVDAMKDNLLYGWAAWNKLYRRELFDTIRFPKGIINEDEAILLHVIELCNNVQKVGIPTYYYFLRENSITTAAFSARKMDWFNNCVSNYHYIMENHPELLPEAEYRLETCVLYLLHNMLLAHPGFEPQICVLQEFLQEHFYSMIRNPYATKKDRIRLLLFKCILVSKLYVSYRWVYQGHRKLDRRIKSCF